MFPNGPSELGLLLKWYFLYATFGTLSHSPYCCSKFWLKAEMKGSANFQAQLMCQKLIKTYNLTDVCKPIQCVPEKYSLKPINRLNLFRLTSLFVYLSHLGYLFITFIQFISSFIAMTPVIFLFWFVVFFWVKTHAFWWYQARIPFAWFMDAQKPLSLAVQNWEITVTCN